MKPSVCALNKPGKEGARNCARQFLTKVMKRNFRKDGTSQQGEGYTAADIEQVIYDNYPNRDSYLDKIARIAVHLSLHTRIGRISWTFQDAIFHNRPRKYATSEMDYLTWLVTIATNEEVLPEVFDSGDAITAKDREKLVSYLKLEHAALLNGLQEIVRKCCDSKVCSPEEYDTTYDELLFKSGTVFHTAARSICIIRKIDDWSPPETDVSIPATAPVAGRITASSLPEEVNPSGEIDYDTVDDQEYNAFLKERTLQRQQTFSQQAAVLTDLKRNYDVSNQLTCLNIDNLIHNMATLQPGKFLELPFGGEKLDAELQQDFLERYRVEIALRKFYLQELRGSHKLLR